MSQSLRSSQGNVEERFSHILQPIRDLAKNWDVDIAHFLEEYLEELDKIEITFDDGVTTMNFSEAALLIQGSAGVYAKKVEYFHALVYQVLDLVTQKKKTVNQAGNNEGEAADSTQQAGDDAQYLPLDDIPDTEGCYFKEQDVSTNKSVRPIPEMPTRLIPLEESEKGDNCLLNKKGEIMGNHCDFNIDTGFITADGSILLEMVDRGLIEMLSRQQETFQAMVQEDISHRQDGSIEGPPAIEENNYQTENMDVINNVTEVEHITEVLQYVQSGTTKETPPRKSQRKRVEFVHASSSKKSSLDPWITSDPHKKTNAVEKPLIKKKPFKIPAVLKDSSTKKRKKKTVVKTELPPLHEVVEKLFSHRPKFPRNPLKVPELPEFEDAFWQEYKLREAVKKEEIKKLKKDEQEEIEAVEKENDEQELAYGAFDADEDDEEIQLMPLIPDIFPENQDLGNIDRLRRENSSVFSEELTLSYEDLVQKHVEKFLASAAEYAQITELSRRVSEWEDKIQPKLLEEESHEPFDIHKYGTFILEQLERGMKRPFKELVKGKQEFDICRYTLATLQLANVYNVELSIVPDKPGNTMDCLYVTLLSTKRHFEELEEYMAPSLKAA